MLPIIAGLSNAIRGGQWRTWLKVPEESKWNWSNDCDSYNALIFAASVLYVTGNSWLALACIPAMFLGATPGWGDYIGALFGIRHENLVENKFLDPLIKKLKDSPRAWGFAGLTLRGLWWGFCLAVPFYCFGYHTAACNFLFTGAYMGLVYLAAGFWVKTRLNTNDELAAGPAWGLGEVFWGVVLWSPLYYL